jgi:lysozyme family protein
MASGRDEIIRRILLREGGVADVGDGKGITRYGQTPGWLSQFGLPIPTNTTEAAENYAAWLRVTRLDRLIGPEADPLADAVIDLAVHSGHVTAIKALQTSVDVRADGVMGPVTLAAIEDRHRAAVRVIAWRIEQQGGLITRDSVRYARYALGWARRNAEHVRGLA